MSTQKVTIRKYTEMVANKETYARVTWMTAGQLLDILNRLDEAEAKLAKPAVIPNEPDYGDIYGEQVLGGEPGMLTAGA